MFLKNDKERRKEKVTFFSFFEFLYLRMKYQIFNQKKKKKELKTMKKKMYLTQIV
jgi:hypothetical protein